MIAVQGNEVGTLRQLLHLYFRALGILNHEVFRLPFLEPIVQAHLVAMPQDAVIMVDGSVAYRLGRGLVRSEYCGNRTKASMLYLGILGETVANLQQVVTRSIGDLESQDFIVVFPGSLVGDLALEVPFRGVS